MRGRLDVREIEDIGDSALSSEVKASADDPTKADYWAQRRGKNPGLLDRSVLTLLAKHNGRCALIHGFLLHSYHEPRSPTEWEQWHRVTRKAITRHAIAHTGSAT